MKTLKESFAPEALIKKNDMVSPIRMLNLYHLLSQIISFNVPGDVVELGCNIGNSAIFMQKFLISSNSQKKLHLYDSFQGLPKPSLEDSVENNPFKQGILSVSKEKLIKHFIDEGVILPEIYEGWFEETLSQLPKQISFAHLDSDLFQSIRVSLEAIYPKLSHNAIVVIDDYGWKYTPGVKKALDEFLKDKPESICDLKVSFFEDSHQAFFRKI